MGKGAPRWAKGLSELEVAFVREYLVDLSKTEAYVRLGRSENRASCGQMGYEMTTRPHVAKAIEEAMHEDGSSPRQWLITKLRGWADANLADFFEWQEPAQPGGEPVPLLKPWKDMPRELTACVREIVKSPDGTIRLKLHDPLKAVEILAKVGAIRLTSEHVVVDDPAAASLTPDLELARKLAFLLQRAARQNKGTPP